MCAITGIIDWHSPADKLLPLTREMSHRLRHRGPDASTQWAEAGVSLAHRRLALIDIKNGQQPLLSNDQRYILIYNGEVYNFRQLRSELREQYAFKTDCDTEVILAAYLYWGTDCLAKFNGMFSFFIWDRQQQKGFAARDLLGIKPFLYTYQHGTFAFASEAKALVTTSPKADLEPILEYLVAPFFSGVETSPFQDIEILPAGHYLTLTRESLRIRQWGDCFNKPQTSESLPRITQVIKDAVSRTLLADRPITSYLSGGVDSTLITSLAQPTQTYSIQFEDQHRFDQNCSRIVISDDAPHAHTAAKELGVPLTYTHVSNQSLQNRIKSVAIQNDLLPAWEQEIAQDALAGIAAQSFRAVLVGDAADETHYGYHFLLDDHCCQNSLNLINRFSNVPIHTKHLPNAAGHFSEKYNLLMRSSGHTDPQAAMTYLIVKRWLPRLLHNGDTHSMAHGLEARVPFADTELIALAEKISPKQGMEKAHLRQSITGLLPESIRLRQKSALPKAPTGWHIYRALLQQEFATVEDIFSEFLDMDLLIKILNNPHPQEHDQSLLYRLCALGYWFKHYKVSIQ